jgi:ribosomal protein S18 acetylase RimI-like enzyme
MELLLRELALMGYSALRLHVFPHNQAARPLYEKHGFAAAGDDTMMRALGPME